MYYVMIHLSIFYIGLIATILLVPFSVLPSVNAASYPSNTSLFYSGDTYELDDIFSLTINNPTPEIFDRFGYSVATEAPKYSSVSDVGLSIVNSNSPVVPSKRYTLLAPVATLISSYVPINKSP